MILMTIGDAIVPRRTVGLAFVLAVLTGCGQHVPATPPTPAPVGPTPRPKLGPTHAGDALRARLADALRGSDPRTADLVASAMTEVTSVEAAWLPGWQVLDVLYRGTPHGRRLFVGLADDDRVLQLAGRPDSFDAMTAKAGVEVADARTAAAVAQVRLDATRTFVHYAYRVDRVEDIQWLPQPTLREQAEQRRLERTYRSRIAPPAARSQATGWALTLWTVDDRSLVEHRLVVSRAGQVADTVRTVESRLPVPETR